MHALLLMLMLIGYTFYMAYGIVLFKEVLAYRSVSMKLDRASSQIVAAEDKRLEHAGNIEYVKLKHYKSKALDGLPVDMKQWKLRKRF